MGGPASHSPDIKGGNPFCFPENVKTQAAKLFGELRQSAYLQNLDPEEFSKKSAHFLAELNALHAFREGNGRTQLTFLALLADNAGHPLNLDKLDPSEMLAAMITSFEGEGKKLAQVIRNLVG